MAEMNAAAYLKSGIEYFEKGDYDRAIADTSEAIRLNPNDASSYGTRGAAYKLKKDFDHAIADLTEAIRLDPNNAPAYGNRGLTYLVKEDYDQAVSDLELAAKIQPENDGIRQVLKQIKAGRSSNISGSTTEETIRKEIKVILIGGIIGAIIAAIAVLIFFGIGGGSEFGLIPVFFGIWMGFCFGGTITLVPFLFKLGWNLFGLWDRLLGFVTSIFSRSAAPLLRIIFFFLRLFLGAICVDTWLAVCGIAGPVWPLIRILMKRGKLKKIQKDAAERAEREAREAAERAAKKKRNRLIILAGGIIVMLLLAGYIVYNSKKNNVTISDSVTIIEKGVVIPAEINGNQVTAIGEEFREKNNFQATHKVVTNDGTNLRLRNSPGFNASQTGSLEYGSSVMVLETGASAVDSDGYRGNWTYVSTPDGKTGWCFGAYLQLLPR